jgi:hypothetical protein
VLPEKREPVFRQEARQQTTEKTRPMSKERLYLFDTTLRARSRAGASPRERVKLLERRARTDRERSRRAVDKRGIDV